MTEPSSAEPSSAEPSSAGPSLAGPSLAGPSLAGPFSLAELARHAAAEVRGDAELRVRRIRPLEHAGPEDLSFLTQASYRERAASSAAAALLVPAQLADELAVRRPLLVAEDAALALARLIELFHPPRPALAGVHTTAVLGEGCEIDAGASIGPYAVLGDGCRVGAGAVIGAHAVLGRGCRVGAGARLHPHVVLYDATELGDGVILHAGVVLGADGFGYASHGGEHVKVPQVGRTVIEAEVEIGALSAVDRAVLEETRIGAGSKIDNLVQVGHNVHLGRGCILCGQAGIAGSAQLGDYVVVAGQAGVAGHLEIGAGAQVAAKSAALQAVPAGRKVAGIPAVDLKVWRRQVALAPRLAELARRLRALEKRLEESEQATEQQG